MACKEREFVEASKAARTSWIGRASPPPATRPAHLATPACPNRGPRTPIPARTGVPAPRSMPAPGSPHRDPRSNRGLCTPVYARTGVPTPRSPPQPRRLLRERRPHRGVRTGTGPLTGVPAQGWPPVPRHLGRDRPGRKLSPGCSRRRTRPNGVRQADGLERLIRERRVEEHPGWEDLSEWEGLEARREKLLDLLLAERGNRPGERRPG